MSEKYIPLYRKYRPKNLQEVVGQEHIKHALSNAITLNKVSHAYLFTGPRGTGKTSIARILAKSLNCQEGQTLTPCEKCPSCVNITNSNPIDVIEIDAASNRKVEDTQNILEKIQYVPVNGKYKIYIIDEVHMLTNHAFNALLKTLEEPPENVIFILATTEPQKVLDTIISRCQRFDFRRITTDDIIKYLKSIAKLEKIKIEDEALFTIAKSAAGGMRDSLALLDQVSVLGDSKTITSEDVNQLLGKLSFDMLNEMSEDIIQSKPQDAIEFLEKIYNSGNEPTQILLNLLGYFKNLLIVKNCVGDELLIDLTQLNSAQIHVLKAQTEKIETHQITFLIEKIVYYIKEIKTTTNQHLWLEIAIIDLANLTQNTSLLALQDRIQRLEDNSGSAPAPAQQAYVARPEQPKFVKPQPELRTAKIEEVEEVVKEEKTISPKASPVEKEAKTTEPDNKVQTQVSEKPSPASQSLSSDINNQWIEFLKNISSAPTVSILSDHAKAVEISEEKFVIGCENAIFLKLLSDETKKIAMTIAAEKMLGKKPNLIIQLIPASEFAKSEKKNPIIKKAVEKPKKKEPENSDFSDDDDFAEHELAKKSKKEEVYSDQVSMVMKLFDGKYIE